MPRASDTNAIPRSVPLSHLEFKNYLIFWNFHRHLNFQFVVSIEVGQWDRPGGEVLKRLSKLALVE